MNGVAQTVPHPAEALKNEAREIVHRLREHGHIAFWVGGCVRDMLLGKPPEDYDIATDARPEEVEAIFERTIPVGRKFGVMIVLIGSVQFEVATFRAEGKYVDGRHPETVVFSHAQADAERRDFTVNGLFYDPIGNTLHDWVGGQADLKARQIRAIGIARERFAEDHLRMLRAIRFAAQLGFEIEPATFHAVQELAPKIQSVSPERIREELVKLFRPPHAARGLALLQASGLLNEVLPEIAATVACDQSPNFHPEGTVFNHLVKMLSLLPSDAAPSLPWAVLMHDVAKPVTAVRDPATGHITFYGHERIGAEMAEAILARLRFPRKQIDEVVTCVLYHMQFKDVMKMKKATLRRMLLRPTIQLELGLHRLDCLGSHGILDCYEFVLKEIAEMERQPSLIPPLLAGKDLLDLGMKPGPLMGRLLAEARDKQLAEEFKTREAALAWAAEQTQALANKPAAEAE